MRALLIAAVSAGTAASILWAPAASADPPGYDCSRYAQWGPAEVQSCERAIQHLPDPNSGGTPCRNIAITTGHDPSECG
jgi:hypothetical protein